MIGKTVQIAPTRGTVNGNAVIADNLGSFPAYVVVTNYHASNDLFLGGVDSTTTAYGLSVTANGGTQSFYVVPHDRLYASSTGRALPTTTSVASTDIFTSTAHGMVAGDMVVFTALTGGAGLSINTVYFVIATNLAANTFMLSATAGGATIDHTTNVTAATVYTGTTVRVFSSGAQ